MNPTASRPALIEARGVTFRAGSRALVDHVSCAFHPGEFVAILGPNGAGKSTLLKLLCGERHLSAGEVFFDNKPLAQWKLSDLARRRAILPQSSAIPFEFTAMEIVLLGRSPYGDAFRYHERALAAMAKTDSAQLADRTVNTLSGGELQRVNLARVLLQLENDSSEPSALLLDEPISNLDPLHQHSTLRLAREAASRGTCVVVVIHDLNLAAQYADRLFLMKSGTVVAQGAPRDVITPEIIQETFSVRSRIVENPLCDAPAVFVDAAPE